MQGRSRRVPPFGTVLLAVPNMGWIRADLALELGELLARGAAIFAPSGLRPTARARNECVRTFLKSQRRYLWFVDADTLPPPGALERLLAADVPAISGLVCQLKQDDTGKLRPTPVVSRRNGEGTLKMARGEGVERIDAAGSGCMLLRRDVLEAIPPPWYEERVWRTPDGRPATGQDFVFCEKLEAAGIELRAHFGVICSHRKEVEL